MSEEILKKVYEIFAKNGALIYLVGGSVRDLLLKREINDYDFATPLPPEKVIEIFRKEGIPTYPIGIEFGTVGVVIGEKEVQITTFRRKEKYPPTSRKPEVEFGGTIEEDLARRDFTINSMAITPQGELIDPFNGKEDLRRGILRTPLSPDISFTDDPLRMLRCFRFQSQLGFTIEENTYGAIRKHAFRIMFLSPERIQMEMDKLLLGDYVEKALKGLMETRLISFFLHELVPFNLNSSSFHYLYCFLNNRRANSISRYQCDSILHLSSPLEVLLLNLTFFPHIQSKSLYPHTSQGVHHLSLLPILNF